MEFESKHSDLKKCVFLIPKTERYKHKKGVGIVSLSYPVFRSWLTSAMDKMTAPHRLSIYVTPVSGMGIATDVGVIVTYLQLRFKPPSLELQR